MDDPLVILVELQHFLARQLRIELLLELVRLAALAHVAPHGRYHPLEASLFD